MAKSSLILPRRFNQQPQGAVEPSELALSGGIRTALLATSSGLSDAFNPRLPITGGAGTSRSNTVQSYGLARSYTAAADYILDSGRHATPEYMWVLHGTFSNIGTWAGLIARTSDNGTVQGWSWQRESSLDVLRVYHDDVGGNVSLGTLNDLLDGRVHCFVGIGRAGGVRLYRDGVLIRSGSIAAGPTVVAGQGQLKIGSSRDSAGLTGTVGLAAFGNTYNESLAQEISANPWQIFRPRKQVLYFDVAGGITGTIATTWENFTSSITGNTTILGTIAQTTVDFTSSITGTAEIPGTITAVTEDAVGALEGSAGTTGSTGTIQTNLDSFTGDLAGTTTIIGSASIQTEDFLSSITGTTMVIGTINATQDDLYGNMIMTANGFVGDAPNIRLRTLVGMGE